MESIIIEILFHKSKKKYALTRTKTFTTFPINFQFPSISRPSKGHYYRFRHPKTHFLIRKSKISPQIPEILARITISLAARSNIPVTAIVRSARSAHCVYLLVNEYDLPHHVLCEIKTKYSPGSTFTFRISSSHINNILIWIFARVFVRSYLSREAIFALEARSVGNLLGKVD